MGRPNSLPETSDSVMEAAFSGLLASSTMTICSRFRCVLDIRTPPCASLTQLAKNVRARLISQLTSYHFEPCCATRISHCTGRRARRDATRLRGHAGIMAAQQGRTWLSDSVPPNMMGSALHPPASPAYSVIGRCCARRLVCIGEHIKRSSVSTEAICACNRASSACSISQRPGRGSGELPRTVIARSAHAETITTTMRSTISQWAGRGSGELPRTVVARSAHAETDH